MRAVDSNIKFVGLEMCCGSESWASTFAANLNTGVPVDAVASHYYSSCNQRDTDTQVMSTVPGFASSVQTIHTNLSANPALAAVPIWITENNVNADFDAGNGMSACNPGQTFVTDNRGSSAFFAAWRPYVFSQVGKAGVQALYHWDFDADAQFGEVDGSTGQTQLSYWVDYWLAQMFHAGTGQKILSFSNTNTADVEVLPVLNTDNSVVILISNHAVASSLDNNGLGLNGKITLDVSALGTFSTASLVTIDSTTSPINGPTAVSISPASTITLLLDGYSVALLKLK
jgi:Glycosyl hydrolase catalytic core